MRRLRKLDSYIIESNKKKSRIPARLDFAQSATGLVLGLFMWAHMMLVGSIILGKGSFYFVAKTMELSFLSKDGHGFPLAVFCAVLTIFTLFIIHALLGVRKFPISWKQHRIFRDQMQMMNHPDTNLWYIQVVTGFLMFFLGSVHLYIMLTHPAGIGPYMSADRVVTGTMWPLYLVLLICVELHGITGLYRLCMKWGWFGGKDPVKSRKRLKKLKNNLSIFFLALGAVALAVFIIIGIGHRSKAGEKYIKPVKAEQIEADEEQAGEEILDETGEETGEQEEGLEAEDGETDAADQDVEEPAEHMEEHPDAEAPLEESVEDAGEHVNNAVEHAEDAVEHAQETH